MTQTVLNMEDTPEGPPRQYDAVELVCDVVSNGVTLPAGTRGTIVELQGSPVEAFTVEFDDLRFGEEFLQDLKEPQFKHLWRERQA
ncbi:MAG: hypothetical protein RID23_11635 [Roseovarius sp.]